LRLHGEVLRDIAGRVNSVRRRMRWYWILKATNKVEHLFGQGIFDGLPGLFNVKEPDTTAVGGMKFHASDLDQPGLAIKRHALKSECSTVEWLCTIAPW
jgi:hypothetical protein